MNLGLIWRTARHFTLEQGFHIALRGMRHASRRQWPAAAQRRINALANALPRPDPGRPQIAAITARVQTLQEAVHASDIDVANGHFRFLGRTVDFGSLGTIDWRRSLEEESSPLWRLTLAYFGWAVPWVARSGPRVLPSVAAALASLERASDWSAPGIFRDLWNPYTASHRLINLLATASLYRAAGGMPSESEELILRHVRFCAAHVEADLERDLQLNHLLKNYVALAVFASALSGFPRGFNFLAREVPRAIGQNVLADGGHAERSPMYHALGLQDLQLLRDTGLFSSEWQPELDKAIERMTRALGCLVHPDGNIALFNDAWLGGAPSPAQLGVSLPVPGRHELPDTGYIRLDGGDDCVIFDSGPIGPDFNPAHGHGDYLTLEASLAGQRFITDFGTPTYATGSLRDFSRSAASHNGPRLEGREPAEFWKSFRVGRRAKAGVLRDPRLNVAPLWAAGWQDGYRGFNTDVKRWVGLWPGEAVLIVDSWRTKELGLAVSDFLIAPPWHARDGALSLDGPISVEIVALAGTAENLGDAKWWPRYGESAPATLLRLKPGPGGFAALAFCRGRASKAVHAAATAVARVL